MDRSVKLLLTLLVLLGGLSVAPAQAGSCAGASMRVEQIEAERMAAATAVSALVHHARAVAERPAGSMEDLSWRTEAFAGSPTIRYGDQALE